MPLHPTVKLIIDKTYRSDFGNLHKKPISEVRNAFKKGTSTPHRVIDNKFLEVITLSSGASIRLHTPKSIKNDGLLFYIKACGYSFGHNTDSDLGCQRLANHLNCKVAAIEHRLAPEFKFPLPFEDCINAVEYLYHYHEKYNINPDKFISWGESSGANISAGLGHYFRDLGQQKLKTQVLFYPPLDYSRSYDSNFKYGHKFLTEISISDYFIRQYVENESDLAHKYISPMLSTNFCGLPHIVLLSAQYDLFSDEHAKYAEKIAQAGGSVDILYATGLVHGFLWHQKYIQEVSYYVRYALEKVQEALK
tara:strand:+ start:1005 stop:1925 length:921 start_codon:yes stop_codon:yes gene_type:complete